MAAGNAKLQGNIWEIISVSSPSSSLSPVFSCSSAPGNWLSKWRSKPPAETQELSLCSVNWETHHGENKDFEDTADHRAALQHKYQGLARSSRWQGHFIKDWLNGFIVGKAVIVKVSFASLGFKLRTFSYSASCATNTLLAKKNCVCPMATISR